ncbi:MAG: S8 family serine peptidase [Phycisphaerales bacterium]|nr:S8 family serine peptidase [Phycisphaerales bacterium]
MRWSMLLLPIAFAGFALSVSPAQATADGLGSDKSVMIRTAHGREMFAVDALEARTAEAKRVNADLADKFGRLPVPAAGYEITDVVIFRLSDEQPATLVVNSHGGATEVTAIDAAPGFYAASCDSVASAISLADALASDDRVLECYVSIAQPVTLRDLPTDPGFPNQWHLRNTTMAIADVNAEDAWNAGYDGTGVIVAVIEGGWQTTHEDLAGNFNAEASQGSGGSSNHATSVAGVIGAVDNNGLGGVGLAHGAQLANIYFGNDQQNADAFGYRNDLNDVKSSSWGPWDLGLLAEMSSVERTALEEATATGRDGLGEIFVWAGGNGADYNDRTDYDPYTSSRFTLCIGGIGDLDYRSDFNETGSSMLVVTHTSGNVRGIYTTMVGNNYTSSFGGTSAAAPLAAGAVALMLQANPNLTWRDVQHVLIDSARKNDPTNVDWVVNGAGRDVNYNYGFGAIDAGAAVALAAEWTNVAEELSCEHTQLVGVALPDNDPVGVMSTIDVEDMINIESVEIIVNATTTYVGDLRIVLTAPTGTESIFTVPREDSQDDLNAYLFTSFRHWDESSQGIWSLTISDEKAGDIATWLDWSLIIHGTAGTILGDLDGDGDVDQSDLGILLATYDLLPGDPHYNDDADLDGDGDVDQSDLGILLAVYGTGT